MENLNESWGPIRTKAFLVDPVSMNVLWMNESASRDFSGKTDQSSSDIKIEQLMPIAKRMDLMKALQISADTGNPQHVGTDLISSTRGVMSTVVSIYRLPDGMLLVLTEVAWRGKRRD